MRVRKVDPTGDMTFGRGQANFYRDVPDGVAQCVMTRLRFQLGEWFLDTTDGTAWQTKVLGKRTSSTRDLVIRSRTLGTQSCTGIDAYSSELDRETRGFSVNMTINTAYGQAVVKGPI